MSKRPTLTVVDTFGSRYEANHISVVKDGDGYALAFEVQGVLHTIERKSVTAIELGGWGDDEEGGSDLSPWGHTMNKAEADGDVDDEQLLERMLEGLKTGRLKMVDTVAEARKRHTEGDTSEPVAVDTAERT